MPPIESSRSIVVVEVLWWCWCWLFVLVAADDDTSYAFREHSRDHHDNHHHHHHLKSENVTQSVFESDKGGGPPVVDLASPPMGFLSWERFRCQTNCRAFPDDCISENLYKSIADALVEGGFARAGYNRVHIDDCWSASDRDPATGALVADPERFPNGGIQGLSKYLQQRGLALGLYTDAGPRTCAGYPGSGNGNQAIDAATFAEWGVSYIKVDGCHLDETELEEAYTEFGQALKTVAHQQTMVYSCSWPAYIRTNYEGGDESEVPFSTMYNQAGCNTWRNWHDIDNSWESVKQIILHWAKNWRVLQSIPPGSFNDADMLLVGDDHYGTVQLSEDQARLQFGFWAMIASPLLIGGDVRTIPFSYQRILLNEYVISINQDVARQQPRCVDGCDIGPTVNPALKQVWTKQLHGDNIRNIATGFFNLGSDAAESMRYALRLDTKPLAIHCSDVWSRDPSQTVCPNLDVPILRVVAFEALHNSKEDTPKTNRMVVEEDWDIKLMESNDGQYYLAIAALRVPPTGHRLVRIYLNETKAAQKIRKRQ